MTVAPQVNGHTHPALPIIRDWRPTGQASTPAHEPPVLAVGREPAPATDVVAEAEAEAIRARARAETEARRIAAEAEADAVRIKAEADADRQRLINERAEMKLARDRAQHEADLAEVNRKREDADRLARKAREADEADQTAQTETAAKVTKSATIWRAAALSFAGACAVVALPVQMAAFYNPAAKWLLAAPIMLEGGAWVVLFGAAAAVAARRPHWHFRLIAWLLAFVAAGINLWHGIHAFDIATAAGTAFASLAGPGVWDLHEHGRIRKRDGRLSWRQARKQRKAEEARAGREASREAARRTAMDTITERLARQREEEFPQEWKYALRLAAATGETTVSDDIWDRTWDVLHAAKPGGTAADVRLRNVAAKRLAAAKSEAPGSTPFKVTSPQAASQMPPTRKPRIYNPPARPGKRTPGDTPKYVAAARKQAAITARESATGTRAEEQK
jgi:hypothetical protein